MLTFIDRTSAPYIHTFYWFKTSLNLNVATAEITNQCMCIWFHSVAVVRPGLHICLTRRSSWVGSPEVPPVVAT